LPAPAKNGKAILSNLINWQWVAIASGELRQADHHLANVGKVVTAILSNLINW